MYMIIYVSYEPDSYLGTNKSMSNKNFQYLTNSKNKNTSSNKMGIFSLINNN